MPAATSKKLRAEQGIAKTPLRLLRDSDELLVSACLSVFRPRRHGNIADWIRSQRIRITSEQNSALAGSYFDPDQTPAVSRLLHSFLEAEGPEAPNVFVLMKDSQSGLTTNFASVVPWIVENRPGNAAYWTDTGANVYAAVDEKFRPFFEACPITRRAFEEREAQQRMLKKTFPGMSMTFMGAGSDSSFKQRTLTYCILDECAGHYPIHGQTTLDLAIARTTTEADARTIAFSKPGACISTVTNEEGETTITSGKHNGDWFHAAYLAGTQEKYKVPCPHCGHRQELKWDNLHYEHCQETMEGGKTYWNEARILTETYYLCESEACRESATGGRILDGHRRQMMLAGEWVPTVGEGRDYFELFPSARPRWRSAQHTALLSLFPNLSFGNLALEHRATRNDPAKARAFLNERGGAPYQPETVSTIASPRLLSKLVPNNVHADHRDYHRLFLQNPEKRRITLPARLGFPPLVGITCDVQQAFFKWVLWAFRPVEDREKDFGEEARYRGVEAEPWCLDWGKCESVADLDALFATELETHDGQRREIDHLMIDSRYPAKLMYEICSARHPYWIPVWGDPKSRAESVKLGAAWQRTHATEEGNINVVHLDANYWAEECRIRRIDNASLDEPSMASPPFRFPPEIRDDKSFMEEILNQHPVAEQDPKTGHWKPIRWGKVQSVLKDDYFDCCKWAPLLWRCCSNPSAIPVINGW